MKLIANKILYCFVIALFITLSSCGGGGGGGGNGTATSFSIGGTVSGLDNGKQVVLSDNGTGALDISQNGSFQFAQKVALNGSYAVTVATQPPGETCVVLNGSDSDVSANITNVKVICSNKTVAIGGVVSGLEAGVSVMLTLSTNNNSITVSQNSNFTFPSVIPMYSLYNVTAKSSSNAEICSVTNNSGIAVSNIANIKVICSAQTLTVSGNVSGLPLGAKVILSNADGDNQPIPLNITSKTNNPFNFLIPYAGSYSINVTAPNKYNCSVNPNNVKDIQANVTNVQIICSIKTFKVTGIVNNLADNHYIILKDNSSAKKYDQSIKFFGGETNFTFKVPDGGSYDIKVKFADGYTCSVIKGSGDNIKSDVSNVVVNCIQQYFSLYSFQGGTVDGENPNGGLILANDGNFYGTTQDGGAYNKGTIFKISPLGVEKLLYSFKGPVNQDGRTPKSALIQATDGNLYGTTYFGGTSDQGTIFRFDLTTKYESPIYSFTGTGNDGANPEGTIIQDGNYLYGTTYGGGANGAGSVFKTDLSGVLTTIHSFNSSSEGSSDGDLPISGLYKSLNGIFYGTTEVGGDYGNGTVYTISSSGVESKLYSFTNNGDGKHPYSNVIQANDGNLYGTTPNAGPSGTGSVFKITLPAGIMSTLYIFKNNGQDGTSPSSGLIQGNDGDLYGVSSAGGSFGNGTIYKITLAGEESALYSFINSNASPVGDLFQYSDGSFYGTTYRGGTLSAGTVFKFKQ